MKAFPFIKQFDSNDCGPACLSMICRYYKRSISIQELREKTQIGKDGVNLLGIIEAAEAVGFRTQPVKLSLETLLKDIRLPSIIHWNQKHFVVLYRVSKRKCYIADPANGLMEYLLDDFRVNWVSTMKDHSEEGIALLIEPTPDLLVTDTELSPENTKSEKAFSFTSILQYVWPYKKLVIQLLLGLGIASLLQLLLPFLTQSIVDVGVNTANIHFIYIVLLAQLALFAGRLIVDFVRSWILLHISTRINVAILTDFLIKLMKLPMGFFESKNTGDILQRMNDHQRIESFLTGSSLNILFSLMNLVIFSVILFVYNMPIFVVFVIASIIYAAWVILFLGRRKQLDYKRFAISSKEQSATIQLIQGMQEIKLHDCEKSMRWSWERLQAKLFKLSIKNLKLNQWQQSGAFFINEGKNIIITFLSAKAVIDGHMTLGAMLAVQYIIGQLNSPVEQMIGFVQNWQNAKISLDRLNEIHKMEDEEPSHVHFIYDIPISFTKQLIGGDGVLSEVTNFFPHGVKSQDFNIETLNSNFHGTTDIANNPETDFLHHKSAGRLFTEKAGISLARPITQTERGCISFENVSFTYPGAGNKAVLSGINLNIIIGKTTAIVGVSGSGKTTLLKLLLKFYEPQKGEIYLKSLPSLNEGLEGTSLFVISHKAWRKRCGVVMQESFIFSDTIAKNIAVGEERLDIEKLWHAINVANIKDMIESLPLGFNTKIGAEGIGISMGQKQRILIARSVYSNPDFIFLDEATNSLDANNENVIVRNLESFFKGRTVIVVAHRLSTVKHADQIVVLNRGVITERGTHTELINLKGEYFALVKNQLELGD